VWNALSKLQRKHLAKPIYVISSNTRVESPAIINLVKKNLQSLQKAAEEQGLPIHTQIVETPITETFWVNLIGKGYPIPYSRNRWCTDRLKIKPINKYILDKIAQYGEVIIVLGLRKAESITRAQAIEKHAIKRSYLKSHNFFPGAYVYLPIVDLTTEDLWEYLYKFPCPWSVENANQELFDLYADAGAEDRPFLMDDSTPPMGNRRFGCWVCTVVNRDASMEALIEKRKEEWLEKLLEYRNFLTELKDPESKAIYRDHRRRNGKVYFKENSKEIAWGQTTLEKGLPQIMLKKLLECQVEVQKLVRHAVLISDEELHEIRRLWRVEQHDWEDQVPIIYNEVTGKTLDWIQDDIGIFSSEDQRMLKAICEENKVPFQLLAALLDLERGFYGMSRRANIYQKIDGIIGKEWRSVDDIIKSQELANHDY
jgi:DNA sulfur modification protein DndC